MNYRRREDSNNSNDSDHGAVERRRHRDERRNWGGRGRQPVFKIMNEWNIRFAGRERDPPIDDVIFRVERLARSCNVHRDDLVDGLHSVLIGDAGDWFWHFLRKNYEPTWRTVREALRKRFVNRGTDAEIRSMMSSRRQKTGERFDDYCQDVERLSFQLREPVREARLVELLRKNAEPGLQQVLCLHDIRSVEEMRARCQRYERQWASRDRVYRSQRERIGKVSELETDFKLMKIGKSQTDQVEQRARATTDDEGENRHVDKKEFIDALQMPAKKVAEMTCWNCDAKGHTYADCQASRRVFCYGCGARDAYKTSCSRCAENLQRRGISGPSRSANPFDRAPPAQSKPKPPRAGSQ